MRSFISNFRPVLYSAGIIAIVEAGVLLFAPPPSLYASNFMELAFFRQENPTKIIQEIKLDGLTQVNPKILQVGDSSGINGTKAVIVEKYLDSSPIAVMSCCGDMGYSGHRYTAEAALARVPGIETIVFYVSPYSLPGGIDNTGADLRESFFRAYLSKWRYLDPPSMGYRMDVTNLAYYGRWTHSAAGNPRNDVAKQEQKIKNWFVDEHGWTARPPEMVAKLGLPPPPTGPCNWRNEQFTDWFKPDAAGRLPLSILYDELSMVAAMARQHRVKLVLVFNPVSCDYVASEDTLAIEREIDRFRRDNPEVIVPFPFVTTWPSELFADPFHVWEPGSDKMAHILGPVLRRVMDDPSFRGIPIAQTKPTSETDAFAVRARTLPSSPE